MNNPRKPLVFFIAVILSGYYASGQKEPKKFQQALSIEMNGSLGFFIANRPKSQYLRSSHASFAELAVTAQTTGTKDWQVENHYPKIGLGILYGNPGSSKYLGKLVAIYPFIYFQLLRSPKFNGSFRMGIGTGWIEKPFDKNTNYKNMMVSTYINGCINLMLQSEIFLNKQYSVAASLSFTHFSNGGIKVPNLGLNIPAVSLGMRYQFNPQPALASKGLRHFIKKWFFYINALAAFKQTYPLESATYIVRILNIETLRDFARIGRYGGGINVCYDKSLSKELAYAPVYAFDKSRPQFQISVYGSYEHVIGRLSIPLQVGVYVYNQYSINLLYENIGVRYYFSKHINAAIQLKTHFGKADYIQWGLGYKL